MAVPVLVRLFAALPESPGAWPPLDLEVTSGGLRVKPSEQEDLSAEREPDGSHGGFSRPSGEPATAPRVTSDQR